jgi:hypothetical protein
MELTRTAARVAMALARGLALVLLVVVVGSVLIIGLVALVPADSAPQAPSPVGPCGWPPKFPGPKLPTPHHTPRCV